MKPENKTPKSFLQYDPRIHGVTQSLLGMWLACREKANYYLLGIDAPSNQQAPMDGEIVHAVIEHATKKIMKTGEYKRLDAVGIRKVYLNKLEREWHKSNPLATPEQTYILERALTFAEGVLPGYFNYWEEFFTSVKWVMAETSFAIPYKTRSGVTIIIRGKIDGAYINKNGEAWVFDTKNKARIEEGRIADILPQDIQMKLYSWAYRQLHGVVPTGIIYNIIRRPGFRDQNLQHLFQKIQDDTAKRPEHYYIQMELTTDKEELDEWENEFADLIDDFTRWALETEPFRHYRNGNACETKYGLCPYLNICNKSEKHFYTIRESIFREL